MKRTWILFALLGLALRLPAQTNEAIRLALISESPDTGPVADVLTVALGNHPGLHLLERDQIDKVYREQGLSAANRNYLKLGQVLGADGLLLLETATEDQGQFLNVRLVAVKPGVVLLAEKFPWPVKDLTEWSSVFANHLNIFLPKLAVLAKDAIPLSVVNLRSSGPSADVEQELKILTVQRLSQEPRLFVLERQKMNLLSEEKALKLDDSAFWDGSYLLDGIVDQNGYSKDTITINARLIPPRGGAPVSIEVSGSRTNLTEVINQLAAKIDEALKIKAVVKEWNAADEAAQYFAEAKWALGWGVLPEAQAAADSAWALGKQDLDCATLRVTAYVRLMPEVVPPNIGGYSNGKPGFHWVHISDDPDPKNVDYAIHALELYYDFCRTSSQGEPKAGSDWYYLGMENLSLASGILQQFCLQPKAQPPVADKLAELRGLARSVAETVFESPSVRSIYYPGDVTVSAINFADAGLGFLLSWDNSEIKVPNIFECAIQWGCFWQERPEDGVAFYRKLMASPQFFSNQSGFLFRDSYFPRLAAWNEEDGKHIPVVWRGFMNELAASTNYLDRLEVKALACADARNHAWVGKVRTIYRIGEVVDADQGWKAARQTLLDFISANYGAIVANNNNLSHQDWGMQSLLGEKSEYAVKFAALQQEQAQANGNREAFEKQKQFLLAKQPYNPQEFAPLFLMGFKDYSKTQAQEILPLLAAYKASLTGTWARLGTMQVGQVEANVNRILNPPAPSSQPPVHAQPRTAAAVVTAAVPPPSTNPPELVTNILAVKKFLEIPLEGLPGDRNSAVSITAHHWVEGKLLLDFQYGAGESKFDANGSFQSMHMVTIHGLAILDPATENWDVITCPNESLQTENPSSPFYSKSTIVHGNLFISDGGQINKFDFQKRAWQVLPISDGGNYELFSVNSRLYAANGSMIIEVLDGGKSTRILASTRRQPPASLLDTQDLWTPTLFEGPGHTLRVSTRSKVCTWTGSDWHEDCAAPLVYSVPAVFADGILWMTDGLNQPARISRLLTESNAVEYCLGQDRRARFNPGFSASDNNVKPMWNLPPDLSLPNRSAAIHQSDLCLLVDHSELQDIVDERQHLIVGRKMLAKDGYHTKLLSFSPDLPLPQKVFLRFDASAGCPPTWMLFTTNFLFLGWEGENINDKIGIWLMPVAQIEKSFAEQRGISLERKAEAIAARAQVKKNLLVKYDLNHNGILEPDEKEAALDDPAFIESELDVIDANHNGWLEAEELAYFDANKNRILEPKEQAEIEIAQHQLAARLLKKYDTTGRGWLDQQEYGELMKAGKMPGTPAQPGNPTPFPMGIRSIHIDLSALEANLNQYTRRELRSHGNASAVIISQFKGDPSQTMDSRQLFRMMVEYYWQHPKPANSVR